LLLEGVHVWPERCDPAGVQGLEDILLLDWAHLRLGHEDPVGHEVLARVVGVDADSIQSAAAVGEACSTLPTSSAAMWGPPTLVTSGWSVPGLSSVAAKSSSDIFSPGRSPV